MVYFVFGKLLYPLWHFLLFWTNCHCCKWPYVHWIIIIKPSGHTVGNGREISQLLDRSTRERVFEFLLNMCSTPFDAKSFLISQFLLRIFDDDYKWTNPVADARMLGSAWTLLSLSLSLSLFTSSFCLRTWAKGKVITWVVLVLWAIL